MSEVLQSQKSLEAMNAAAMRRMFPLLPPQGVGFSESGFEVPRKQEGFGFRVPPSLRRACPPKPYTVSGLGACGLRKLKGCFVA